MSELSPGASNDLGYSEFSGADGKLIRKFSSREGLAQNSINVNQGTQFKRQFSPNKTNSGNTKQGKSVRRQLPPSQPQYPDKENQKVSRYTGRTGYKGSYRLSVSPHNINKLNQGSHHNSNKSIRIHGDGRAEISNQKTTPFSGITGVVNNLKSNKSSLQYDIRDHRSSRGASHDSNYNSGNTINGGLGEGIFRSIKENVAPTDN